MSNARSLFNSRIASLVNSLGIDAVQTRPLTEQAHNDVARMLRNGLAVVGFAALEDFIKSRVSEVLSEVGPTNVPFGLWIQLVDATHSLNISAGVLYPKVFLGRSFNFLAIASSSSCE